MPNLVWGGVYIGKGARIRVRRGVLGRFGASDLDPTVPERRWSRWAAGGLCRGPGTERREEREREAGRGFWRPKTPDVCPAILPV